MNQSFKTMFSHERVINNGPHEFRRAVQRLIHAMGHNCFSIDGAYDHGGDLYCEINEEIWILQVKWKKSGAVKETVINEMLEARNFYYAHKVVLVTNGQLARKTEDQLRQYERRGIGLGVWNSQTLFELAHDSPNANLNSFPLRKYQKIAKNNILRDLHSRGFALLYLATGLGKTVVAGSVIKDFFEKKRTKKVLVLAHMTDLIQQLQISLWSFLNLSINTQLLDGANKPIDLDGVTIATNMSALSIIENGYRPDLIIIDECHHVGFDNTYKQILDACKGVPTVGVTATPWRGDGYDIEAVFGAPSSSCSLEEGMAQGYLSKVNYKLLCDNIDWDIIPELSSHEYTISQLNKKLFLPQRDALIIDELLIAFNEIVHPKCVIFCQSIEHARQLYESVIKVPKWSGAELIHSGKNSYERRQALLNFRGNDSPMLLAVDILNEGVDIPSVNIVCFARVTHSRKIFVQQLGRGLRISDDKEYVLVLDFAADIRRAAAIKKMQDSVRKAEESNDIEILETYRSKIEFSDTKAEEIIEEWLKDASSLDTANDEYRLNFPST